MFFLVNLIPNLLLIFNTFYVCVLEWFLISLIVIISQCVNMFLEIFLYIYIYIHTHTDNVLNIKSKLGIK